MELKFFKIKMSAEEEIQCMYEMLLNGNSFKSFCDNNEVFDVNKHRVIKKRNQLFQLYAHGININRVVIILNKN